MKANNLLNKGHKKVSQWAKQNGFLTACVYENDGNNIIELIKTHAGITIDKITVIFNKDWRVIKIL